MGVCKIIKWFKTTTRSDKDVQSPSPVIPGGNEYYRNLLQQFANRCQTSNGDISDPDWILYLPKEENNESSKKDKRKLRKRIHLVPGVPHIRASEIFEIGYVAGTENRYLELISAEWHNTKVTLKRHVYPPCRDAIKVDVEILSEIRHPNILLLMATTHMNEHGLVSIFEPVDCTLYNYIHEQGERINIQRIMQIGIKLADALKYCHMRGYIHGAISSHCVYFASDTTIKLGGWELARQIENISVEHDYEKYLRLETFKWQAPEMSYGQNPSKKTDVYCLLLLLWEMCTGNIPWCGFDQSNVKRRYAMRKRDVVVNLQNVPSILHNLLEAGLQPDEAKRTLDMEKIGKKLHRLLMIYEETEEKDGTCAINECGNNNNDPLYNDTLSRKVPPALTVGNKKFIKNDQSIRTVIERRSPDQFFKSKQVEQCNGELKSKNDTKNISASTFNNSIVSPVTKVEIVTPCTRCAEISNIVQNIDDESDARTNIRRLKELIASKRENFFLGIDDSTFSSFPATSPKATSTLLSQTNSPDYVLCKPASHTITMEPKFKSLSEYGAIRYKSSYAQPRKAPYTSMPESIKHAIIQPKVLHSDAKSFYESTLWRKEKEICISRMGRDNKEYKKSLPLSQSINDVTPVINNDKIQYSKNSSTDTNNTYTIKATNGKIYTEDTKESSPKNVRSIPVSINVSTSPHKSIQDLKNALDRATKIIHSTTPSKSCHSNLNDIQERENLYEMKYDEEEIKVIENGMSDNENFLGINRFASTENNEVVEHDEIFNQAFINNKTLGSAITRSSSESGISTRDQQPTNSQEINKNKTAFSNECMFSQERIDLKSNEKEYVNINAISKNIGINDELKRRSLPARLNNLGIPFSPAKITHKKNAQDSQYTIEELYIDDDEFGSRLNDNLALLDDMYLLNTGHLNLLNILNDNESLPQTTEL
ncbi:uncharacterized protein [Linepithema humile]|uniref:uncharacterized protein isoform X2 n=1 Tax=Linepithema humile TaxID=83485 RepID=UPI000623B6FE|nr:PREDICTED: uncharacterized protein LOC105674350 isoform X2 [Linepithema humile]